MKDKFLEFAKTPLGTAIAIGLYCVIMLVYILSRTSFGKKAINSIKYKFDYLLGEFKKHKEDTEKKLEEQNKYLKEQLEKQEEAITYLCDYITSGLECINNKKVQETIRKYTLNEETHNEEENKAQQG